MTAAPRVAYFNGRFMPEREVLIPYRDLSALRGYGAFDLTRTFHGRAFRLKEHVERLYRSLRYLDIDCGLPFDEMMALSEETLDRNRPLLTERDDYWIGQRISAGVQAIGDEGWDHVGPNVIIECCPLPIARRAHLFRDGIQVVTPATPRTPARALSPRAKMNQYLNMILAGNDVKRLNPNAWALLLDETGNLAEGEGNNIFLVSGGVLLTPRSQNILPGISRATVIEIAGSLGIEVRETDLDLYDAAVADEMFIASTSLCLCPVSSFNGRRIGTAIPGPVTQRLTAGYIDMVGCDFVQQHLSWLQ
ncbi:aminotransferase class IV [Inquilinus sp.]|jgi:branched-chain amino acid aminotransferase|uniref:aminotransferase class IV n=1 Tax=Inquilinus sp. TaxID=1932117 RepID=UPI003784E3DA